MSIYKGTAGTVAINGTVVGRMREWAAQTTTAELETSAFGQGWRTFVAGINEWSGTFEGLWDGAEAAQRAVESALMTSSKVWLDLYEGPGVFLSGRAAMVGLEVGHTLADKAALGFAFRGDNELYRYEIPDADLASALAVDGVTYFVADDATVLTWQ